MSRALLIPPDPATPITVEELADDDDGARDVRRLIGGDFEGLPPLGRPDVIGYCHGEGKFIGLAPNPRATRLWGGRLLPGDQIVGPVVLSGLGRGGATRDVPEDLQVGVGGLTTDAAPPPPAGEGEHLIVCRAQVVAGCYDGRPTSVQFGEDLAMDADGTYDGSSIVCDACYVALVPRTPSGQGLHHELAAAIAAMRGG